MTFIVIIEPNPLLRLGIFHLLSEANIAMSFADYSYSQIKNNNSEIHPDLVIISISCTDNISEIAAEIDQTFSPTSILLLSDTPEAPTSVYGASNLIAGCIYRHAAPEILQASVQLILAGGRCFPSTTCQAQQRQQRATTNGSEKSSPTTLVSLLATEHLVDATAPPTNEAALLGLTPRQYEVLVLLARGYPMKTVSRHLNISVATAKSHTESLYQRLDVKNRNAAVHTAISRGATLGWESISNHH